MEVLGLTKSLVTFLLAISNTAFKRELKLPYVNVLITQKLDIFSIEIEQLVKLTLIQRIMLSRG